MNLNTKKDKLKANKDLGQHFLNSTTVKAEIVATVEKINSPLSAIIEVGPGKGSISEFLLKLKSDETQKFEQTPLHFIETDDRFIAPLKLLISRYLNCKGTTFLHHEDALQLSWNDFVHDKGNVIWLVSNLPYNISVPLLIRFIKTPSITHLTLMFQKEVALRIVGLDNFKKREFENNSLHTLCSNFFEVELVTQVKPADFSPPPKVDSTVLFFKRKESPIIPLTDFLTFEKFLRQLFIWRRKQIQKVLNHSLNFTPEHTHAELTRLNISPTERAENLSLETIYELFQKRNLKS